MSKQLPRAPKLESGTCIATPALFESAQRVFFHHTTSPIHWIDLCTIIEAILLHDKIAFPVVHSAYAEPLLKPLTDAGLADPWWPESQIFNRAILGGRSKEEIWRDAEASAVGMPLMLGGWPDDHYDGLSEVRKKAINGIAHGFSEPALLPDNDELSVLLWGRTARLSSESKFEAATISCLRRGIDDIKKMSPEDRSAFRRPHENERDIYNDYAKHLRDLANDSRSIIVKGLVEESFFDPTSVEAAAHDSLFTILKQNYRENVVDHVGKYVRVIPASPFAGIAFSKASKLEEVVSVAVDLRDSFKRYRELLKRQRAILAELEISQNLNLAKKLEEIDFSFTQALQLCLSNMDVGLERRPKSVFDPLHGLIRLVAGLATGDYKSLLDKASKGVIDLLQSWNFMSYGGVYEIVNHLPKVSQLDAASQRLIKKHLDLEAATVLREAAGTLKHNCGLTAFPAVDR